jgi:hypothetical protein
MYGAAKTNAIARSGKAIAVSGGREVWVISGPFRRFQATSHSNPASESKRAREGWG